MGDDSDGDGDDNDGDDTDGDGDDTDRDGASATAARIWSSERPSAKAAVT